MMNNNRFGCGVISGLLVLFLIAVYIVAALWTGTPMPWSVWERNKVATERQVASADQSVASQTAPDATPNVTATREAVEWRVRATAAAEATATAMPTSTPEPTVATKGPAVVVTVQSAGQPITSTDGVTTEVAKVLFGIDVQRLATEPSAFVWRSQGVASTQGTCPAGWVCTWSVVGDIVVVHEGVGQTTEITAGTWREETFYPEGVCTIFRKEKAFGAGEVPSFQVRYQAVDGAPETCE